VEFDRGLGRNLGKQVRDELGQRRQEQERRGEKHADKREGELEQVRQVSALGERADQNERVGERGLDDPRRRAADRGVALVESRSGSLAEVRDDDPEVEGAAHDSAYRQQRAGNAVPSREGVPDAEPCDDERQLLLRYHGQCEEGRGGKQPLLVEVPDREDEQRARRRHRVEFVERKPLHRGIEQVDEREEGAQARGAEVLARKPEDW
jgi:hypothetical protein